MDLSPTESYSYWMARKRGASAGAPSRRWYWNIGFLAGFDWAYSATDELHRFQRPATELHGDTEEPIQDPKFVVVIYRRGSIQWVKFRGQVFIADGILAGFEKVPGSLVLGGYDPSKAGTNMSFGFAPDISRDLTVGLQAISAMVNGQDYELLPKGIFTFIDSTVPYIWLPVEACQQFESALGLTWDTATNLYLVNDTLHTNLLAPNASLTFKIENTTEGGATVDIKTAIRQL